MANLVELVKQAALEAVAAAHPAQAVFGKVTDTEPLAVRIHQKLRLTAEFLALSETVRTKLAAKSLRPGDTLLLLQQQGGQRFLALDVLPGADWTPPAAAPVTWADIAGKPAAFPPAPHAHTAAEVGAAPAAHTHTPAEIGAAPKAHAHTAAEIGAAPASHTHRRGNRSRTGRAHACRIRYCRRYASARTRRYGRGKRRRGAHESRHHLQQSRHRACRKRRYGGGLCIRC